MKNLKVLMLLPIFALTACGGAKGAEVDDAKAKEVAKNISTAQKDVKTLDFSMEMTIYDAEKKSSETSTYAYKFNENGDVYVGTSGSSSEGSSSSAYYRVKNDKYEEVIYYTTTSKNTGDAQAVETTACYGKKGNEVIYTTISASIGSASVMTVETVYSATDPVSMITQASLEKEEGYDVKYYSSGDKNLTIEIKVDGSKAKSSEDEDPIKTASATYVYENGLFAKATVSTEYTSGDKMDSKYEAKYSGVKISLPDGWEEKVNK